MKGVSRPASNILALTKKATSLESLFSDLKLQKFQKLNIQEATAILSRIDQLSTPAMSKSAILSNQQVQHILDHQLPSLIKQMTPSDPVGPLLQFLKKFDNEMLAAQIIKTLSQKNLSLFSFSQLADLAEGAFGAKRVKKEVPYLKPLKEALAQSAEKILALPKEELPPTETILSILGSLIYSSSDSSPLALSLSSSLLSLLRDPSYALSSIDRRHFFRTCSALAILSEEGKESALSLWLFLSLRTSFSSLPLSSLSIVEKEIKLLTLLVDFIPPAHYIAFLQIFQVVPLSSKSEFLTTFLTSLLESLPEESETPSWLRPVIHEVMRPEYSHLDPSVVSSLTSAYMERLSEENSVVDESEKLLLALKKGSTRPLIYHMLQHTFLQKCLEERKLYEDDSSFFKQYGRRILKVLYEAPPAQGALHSSAKRESALPPIALVSSRLHSFSQPEDASVGNEWLELIAEVKGKEETTSEKEKETALQTSLCPEELSLLNSLCDWTVEKKDAFDIPPLTKLLGIYSSIEGDLNKGIIGRMEKVVERLYSCLIATHGEKKNKQTVLDSLGGRGEYVTLRRILIPLVALSEEKAFSIKLKQSISNLYHLTNRLLLSHLLSLSPTIPIGPSLFNHLKELKSIVEILELLVPSVLEHLQHEDRIRCKNILLSLLHVLEDGSIKQKAELLEGETALSLLRVLAQVAVAEYAKKEPNYKSVVTASKNIAYQNSLYILSKPHFMQLLQHICVHIMPQFNDLTASQFINFMKSLQQIYYCPLYYIPLVSQKIKDRRELIDSCGDEDLQRFCNGIQQIYYPMELNLQFHTFGYRIN